MITETENYLSIFYRKFSQRKLLMHAIVHSAVKDLKDSLLATFKTGMPSILRFYNRAKKKSVLLIRRLKNSRMFLNKCKEFGHFRVPQG